LRRTSKQSKFSFEDAAARYESEESGFEAGVAEIAVLSNYLEQIDIESRLILEMKYLEQKTYKQIAAAFGIKTKTVEVRIARAKAKIREICRKEGERYAREEKRYD